MEFLQNWNTQNRQLASSRPNRAQRSYSLIWGFAFGVIIVMILSVMLQASQVPTITHSVVTVGSLAPTFVLRSLEGDIIYLRDCCGNLRAPWRNKKKQVVVMSFFTTWCKPCLEEITVLQEAAFLMKDKPVAFLLVNLGEDSTLVNNFAVVNQINFPILMDEFSTTARAFGLIDKNNRVALPRMFLINREGVVTYTTHGIENAMIFKKRLLDELAQITVN